MSEDDLLGDPIDDVPTKESDEDCNGRKVEKRDDAPNTFRGYCGATAGRGTDHVGMGRCKHHGGLNSGENGQGGTENNGNAETHGLTSDGEKWFKRHRSEAEDDVQRMVASWMKAAPFDWSAYGNVRLLVDAAINECQVRRGDEYIEANDVVVEHYDGHDQVSGREKREYKANPAFGYKTQLQNSTLRILDKLDIINDDADTSVEVNIHEELLSGLKAAHSDDE